MMNTMLSLSDANFTGVPRYQFLQDVLSDKMSHFRSYEWQTLNPKTLIDLLPDARAFTHASDGDELAYVQNHEQSLRLLVSVSLEQVHVSVAGDDAERIDAEIGRLKKLLPIAEKPDSTAITFWYQGSHGPASLKRLISVPEWVDIADNYAPDVHAQLADQMQWRPTAAGQLLLWHGNPGTGKTYALRALARSWQPWCDVHYITDPDNFFGKNVGYLMSTIFSNQHEDSEDSPVVMGRTAASNRWRLVVLEDAGELLVPDAREQVGQALSRLLNLVDGLLGQGLRVLVLITTNEPLGKLHPAVARPGRCASRIEFKAMDVAASKEWLRAHDGDAEHVTHPRTIAELFAEVSGRQPVQQPEKMLGFSTPLAGTRT